MRAGGSLPGETAIRRLSFHREARGAKTPLFQTRCAALHGCGGVPRENKPMHDGARLAGNTAGGSIFRGDGNLPVLSRGCHIDRAPEVAAGRQRCESAYGFRSLVRASALAGDQVRGHHRRGRTPSAEMRRRARELPDSADAPAQALIRHRRPVRASLPMMTQARAPRAPGVGVAQRRPRARDSCGSRRKACGQERERVPRCADVAGQVQQADDERGTSRVAHEQAERAPEERPLLVDARRDTRRDQSAARAAYEAPLRTPGNRSSRALRSSMNASIHALTRAESVIGPM